MLRHSFLDPTATNEPGSGNGGLVRAAGQRRRGSNVGPPSLVTRSRASDRSRSPTAEIKDKGARTCAAHRRRISVKRTTSQDFFPRFEATTLLTSSGSVCV
jgi:hypothetical protein